jgi:hypothetical protein
MTNNSTIWAFISGSAYHCCGTNPVKWEKRAELVLSAPLEGADWA